MLSLCLTTLDCFMPVCDFADLLQPAAFDCIVCNLSSCALITAEDEYGTALFTLALQQQGVQKH